MTVAARRSSLDLQRATLALMMVAVFGLWIYIAVRSVDVAFTTDEAASYGIIHGVPTFVQTANNQWLNTLLMRVSQALFGQTDWVFRLPNVLAFGLYAAASLLLIARLRSTAVRIIAFVLLLTDPFLLEFFGLARGYGLSVAFSAGALAAYFWLGAATPGPSSRWRLACAGAMSSLAFYANFAALNLTLALLAAAAIESARQYRSGSQRRGRELIWSAAILIAAAASLIPGIVHVQYLRRSGQLYYGGRNGLVADTVGSLISTWHEVYATASSAAWTAAEAAVVAVAVGALLWSLIMGLRGRRWTDAQRAALLFALTALAAQFEASLLNTRYPIDRVALIYALTFAVLCAFVFDDVAATVRVAAIRWGFAALAAGLAAVATVNLLRTANLTRTVVWPGDASSRAVINTVIRLEQADGRPARPWTLLSGFPQNYALDYYRQIHHLAWLEPITRAPTSTSGGDLYLVAQPGALPPGTTLLATFPETHSQLRAGPALRADP